MEEQLELLPQPTLIGLYSPKAGMGKSSVADFLCWNHKFVRVKFANPLKKMIDTMLIELGYDNYSLRHDCLEGCRKEHIIPELGVSTRYLMETLGTRWGRQMVHDDIWVQALTWRIDRMRANGHSVVVDDLRHPNEYDALASRGAKMVVVHRPGDVFLRDPLPSESKLGGFRFDYGILNNGTVDDLSRLANYLVERIRTGNENFFLRAFTSDNSLAEL